MATLTAASVEKTKNGATIITFSKDGKKVARMTPSGIKIPKDLPDGSLWRIRIAATLATADTK